MKPVVIITAVPQESGLLETALGNSNCVTAGGYACVAGVIGALPVIICCGGIGKINAAAATAVMIERYQPRLVINTGCAGAYIGSGLEIGNLVVASEEVLADDGVLVPEGWKDLRYMNLPTVRQGGESSFNILPLSRNASELALQFAAEQGIVLTLGRSATVSTCSGTLESGAELSRRWNALMENMEGAAVAQVCLRSGIDCLEIRGVSNMVEERDLKKWDLARAVEAAQRFVLNYLEELDRSGVPC